MKSPFKLPVQGLSGIGGFSLVAANSELIGHIESATAQEAAYIVHCVNNHKRMKKALKRLLKAAPDVDSTNYMPGVDSFDLSLTGKELDDWGNADHEARQLLLEMKC